MWIVLILVVVFMLPPAKSVGSYYFGCCAVDAAPVNDFVVLLNLALCSSGLFLCVLLLLFHFLLCLFF